MKNFIGRLKTTAFLTLFFGLGLFALLFGTSILNNVHNAYLRYLSTWTVKLTNSQGHGATGFVVKGASGQKYIMTNGHVCNIADDGVLTAEYKGEQFQVEVYKQFQWNDLCAMKAHRPLGPAARIAAFDIMGESTWVIGHPLLEPRSVAVGELSGTTTVRVIVGFNPPPGTCEGPTYTKIDLSNTMAAIMLGADSACIRSVEARASTMSILPGNSGSPTVDAFGSVVGVAFAGSTEGNRSYFVPLLDLKEFLGEL